MLRAARSATAVRFALVGLAITGLHLAVFRLASSWLVAEEANVVAFLVATQVNFAVSYWWTWSGRRLVGTETVGSVLRRAVVFNGTAAVGFGVNAVVFSLAYRVAHTPSMASALIGTLASAGVSFLLSSRIVFARRPLTGQADPIAPLPLPLDPSPLGTADRQLA
jgi:putative flippase GtrA